MVTVTYILNAPIGFGLSMNISYIGATIATIAVTVIFFIAAKKARANNISLDDDVSGWKNVS